MILTVPSANLLKTFTVFNHLPFTVTTSSTNHITTNHIVYQPHRLPNLNISFMFYIQFALH